MNDIDFSSEKINISDLKSGGYMKQRQPDLFCVRVKVLIGDITAEQMKKVAELSEKYGRGYSHLTMRQGIEIPFVHFDNLKKLTDELKTVGLINAPCGARVRSVVSCQGATLCPRALGDSQGLAKKMDKEFFGQGGLPHKYKIGITGCSAQCAKPADNDIGFMGVVEPEFTEEACISCAICEEVCPSGAIKMVGDYPRIDYDKCIHCGDCISSCASGSLSVKRKGWNTFVGGKWGKEPEIGKLVAEFLNDDEAIDITASVMNIFKKFGKNRERLGSMINRIGFDEFKKALS